MPTPEHNWHHDVPQIRIALEIAEMLAQKHGTNSEQQRVAYALKRLNDWQMPGQNHGFSDRDIAEMNRLQRHD